MNMLRVKVTDKNLQIFMTVIIGILGTLLLKASPCVAQSNESFFPLKIGNRWITLSSDEAFYKRYAVTDTVRLEEKLYYTVEFERKHFYREDSLQNFYEYFDGKEQLIMDFKMEVGDSIPISEGGSSGYAVCIEKKEITTFIGTIDEQKTFFLDLDSILIDEEQTFTLQRGVGPYFFKPYFHESAYLVAAILDGVAYGDSTVLSVEEPGEKTPKHFDLQQNFPNPFNATTTISFQAPATIEVTLEIYNILGKKVAVLIKEIVSAGQHQVKWHGKDGFGRDVASGLYMVVLTTDKFRKAQKILLLK